MVSIFHLLWMRCLSETDGKVQCKSQQETKSKRRIRNLKSNNRSAPGRAGCIDLFIATCVTFCIYTTRLYIWRPALQRASTTTSTAGCWRCSMWEKLHEIDRNNWEKIIYRKNSFETAAGWDEHVSAVLVALAVPTAVRVSISAGNIPLLIYLLVVLGNTQKTRLLPPM